MKKLILFLLLIPCQTFAIPQVLNYQGRIFDSNGAPLSGVVNADFKLYTQTEGGSEVWEQTLSVTFDNGYCSVELGPGNPALSTDLFDGSDLYLGLTLEGVAEFQPRTRLVTVPFAMRSGSVTGTVDARNGLLVDGVEVVDSSGNINIPGNLEVGGAMMLPRLALNSFPEPSEDNKGQLIFDADENNVYVSNGSEWVNLAGGSGGCDVEPPIIDSITPRQIEPGVDATITIDGQAFVDGCEVQLNENFYSEITFVNAGQVTVQTGDSLDSGLYYVRVTNPIGWRDTLVDALLVDSVPIWVTPEGDLGIVVDSLNADHFTLEATDDEGQDLTYTLSGGALPDGLSLNSETGIISGDPVDVEDDMVYTFVIAVSDTARDPNQVEREFSITVSDLIGNIAEAPGLSCKHINDTGSADGNGLYWIDPNGDDPGDSYQAYCDMITDGGGWTLVFNLDTSDSNTRHFHDATFWTGANTEGSISTVLTQDFKGEAYNSLGLNEKIMVWVHNEGTTSYGKAMYDVLGEYSTNTFYEVYQSNDVVLTTTRQNVIIDNNHGVPAQETFIERTEAIKINHLRAVSCHNFRDHTRFATTLTYSDCPHNHYVSGLGGEHYVECCGTYGWRYEAQMYEAYCNIEYLGTNRQSIGANMDCHSGPHDIDYAIFTR